MLNLKHAILGAAAAGAMLFGISAPASADVITFTWNPSASSPVLSTGPTTFTADDINVFDYALIDVPTDPTPIGSVTESGFLKFSSFGLGGSTLPNPFGFNGTAGATPYQLYITFTATGHLTPLLPGILAGAFDTLDFTLWGDPGGLDTFTATGGPTATGTGDDVKLATGTLAGGLNQAIIASGIPSANVETTFVEEAGQAGFFIDPPALINLFMENAFTNTPGVVTSAACGADTCFTINGGGGNIDFTRVPEPGTLGLLGSGLMMLGFGAWRRRKAA